MLTHSRYREIATKDKEMAALEAAHAVAILTKNEEMAAFWRQITLE
jgi:hypothetical protein